MNCIVVSGWPNTHHSATETEEAETRTRIMFPIPEFRMKDFHCDMQQWLASLVLYPQPLGARMDTVTTASRAGLGGGDDHCGDTHRNYCDPAVCGQGAEVQSS